MRKHKTRKPAPIRVDLKQGVMGITAEESDAFNAAGRVYKGLTVRIQGKVIIQQKMGPRTLRYLAAFFTQMADWVEEDPGA